MKTALDPERGISLIEALVAVAIMAFGMLALLGLQGTLRGNSDISKQRAEAVRMAQLKLEEKRSFSVLETAGPNKTFAEIASEPAAPADAPDYFSSTTFSRAVTVTQFPPPTTTPTLEELYYVPTSKQVIVTVTWSDRNEEAQLAQLQTIISRTSPIVAASLTLAGTGSVVQQPGYRNINVPKDAFDLPSEPGKSLFAPPNSTGVYWKFENFSGKIVAICPDSTGTGCDNFTGYLLSGYIRYAVGSQPTSTDSETPPDLALPVANVAVGVSVHSPTYLEIEDAAPVRCYVDTRLDRFGAYYCAMDAADTGNWSGRATVTFNRCWSTTTRHDGSTPLSELTHPYRCVASDAALFASSNTDASINRYRICRYTTRRQQAVVGEGDPPFRNYEHPLDYLGVSSSLSNQNFLVIRAGNGASVYACPEDDSSTPLNGTTWFHQPVE